MCTSVAGTNTQPMAAALFQRAPLWRSKPCACPRAGAAGFRKLARSLTEHVRQGDAEREADCHRGRLNRPSSWPPRRLPAGLLAFTCACAFPSPCPTADAHGVKSLREELHILNILHISGCGERVIQPLATVRWAGEWWEDPEIRATRYFQVRLLLGLRVWYMIDLDTVLPAPLQYAISLSWTSRRHLYGSCAQRL